MGSAARDLGVATTTVSRRITALEEAVGLRLFDRTPDGISATREGERLAVLAVGVEERINELERAVALECTTEPSGDVRISATEAVCTEIIAPALQSLCQSHPGLKVILSSDWTTVSLARREADLVVRMARPTGQSLVIRKLGTVRLGLYATVRYAESLPSGGDRLRKARLIGYDDTNGTLPEAQWFCERGYGESFVLRSNSTRVLMEATRADMGVGLLPDFLAVRHPELRRVPSDDPLPERDLWLAYHESFRDNPAVRAVSNHLVSEFGRVLAASSDSDS